jgi:hypothetical protein
MNMTGLRNGVLVKYFALKVRVWRPRTWSYMKNEVSLTTANEIKIITCTIICDLYVIPLLSGRKATRENFSITVTETENCITDSKTKSVVTCWRGCAQRCVMGSRPTAQVYRQWPFSTPDRTKSAMDRSKQEIAQLISSDVSGDTNQGWVHHDPTGGRVSPCQWNLLLMNLFFSFLLGLTHIRTAQTRRPITRYNITLITSERFELLWKHQTCIGRWCLENRGRSVEWRCKIRPAMPKSGRNHLQKSFRRYLYSERNVLIGNR